MELQQHTKLTFNALFVKFAGRIEVADGNDIPAWDEISISEPHDLWVTAWHFNASKWIVQLS